MAREDLSDDEFSRILDEKFPDRLRDQTPDDVPSFNVHDELARNREIVEPVEEPEEPVVDDSPQLEVVAPVVPEKYAGKTAEELIEMHQNLESRLGQQGQELGELRALRSEFDQLRGAMEERAASTPATPITQDTVDWVEESVVGNPRGTLEWVEQNQPALKERALATWAAIDPFAAATYNTEKMLAAQQARFDQELAAVKAPVAAQQTDRELATAYQAVSESLPGFNEVAGDLPAILDANPELRVALVSGDLAQKQRVLGNLGKMAFADRALAQQNAPVAPEVPTVPVVDPRVVASVASGSSTGEHGGEAIVTEAQRLKASMLASEPTSIHEELARNRAAAR